MQLEGYNSWFNLGSQLLKVVSKVIKQFIYNKKLSVFKNNKLSMLFSCAKDIKTVGLIEIKLRVILNFHFNSNENYYVYSPAKN